MDVLKTFTEIRENLEFDGYFQHYYPIFSKLTPSAKKEFLFEGLFAKIKNPAPLDLLMIQVVQNDEYLSLLDIDVTQCYGKNLQFMETLFQDIGIPNASKRAQFFFFFLDGLLFNQAIFSRYQFKDQYEDWISNAWTEVTHFLNSPA